MVGYDFAESIITMIVFEPMRTMAQKFNDMTGQHMLLLKEFVSDIFLNQAKQWQLSGLKKSLRKRADFTLDSLTNAHHVQLEILVALKTGLQEYLLQKFKIPSADLAEIFLYMRCRKVNCRILLSVVAESVEGKLKFLRKKKCINSLHGQVTIGTLILQAMAKSGISVGG